MGIVLGRGAAMYDALHADSACRLPADVIDKIVYEHADIDTRLRVRAPPRRIPKAALAALGALIEARDRRVRRGPSLIGVGVCVAMRSLSCEIKWYFVEGNSDGRVRSGTCIYIQQTLSTYRRIEFDSYGPVLDWYKTS